ncbi:LHFPL tetraspan subfamily member 2a protein [Chionoecetes opilio]|uniref:LHFPL tetraspan subfamily member 2a protein n=1 Tax=Chionoecetes opilio TaxID=41210 RepID=A0A8J4YZ36_CHIOP|nr:LHFPL tetraspan subfamily member 2a protein [Chionoecetes opilio]
MCGVVVIVTRWWLVWVLASVACLMALLGANLSPSWLIGPTSLPHPAQDNLPHTLTGIQGGGVRASPSLGLWLRCTVRAGDVRGARPPLRCGVYATRVPDLPAAQVAALVGVAAGTVLAAWSCVAVVSATCVRLVKGRSWFTIIGITQAVAGVLSLAGVALFPLAWNSPRARFQCGPEADLYYPSWCIVGWATYATLAGSVGLLLCSCLASIAARSTTADEVTQEINKGSTVVILV